MPLSLQVFACEDVPLEWRECHAIAAYTFARPGELRVLDFETDVDLDDQKLHITKAWDYENDKVKATKTEETRSIAIEPELLPLLRIMKERAKGKGLVVPVLSTENDNKLAIITRKHFEKAGCKRVRLSTRNTRELNLRFRSWRDAGVTWSIVRGDDVVKVQRRAGHRLIATTMKYCVEAENTGAAFGIPFAPLPACLLEASKSASKKTAGGGGSAENKPIGESGRRVPKPAFTVGGRSRATPVFPLVSRTRPRQRATLDDGASHRVGQLVGNGSRALWAPVGRAAIYDP